MKTRAILALSGLTASMLLSGVAFAKVDDRATVAKGSGGAVVSIPAHAVEIAPDVYSLGTVKHEGKIAEGIMVVHRKNNAKPSGKGGGGSTTCYSYLASGAKWKTAEDWVINPANNFALTDLFLLDTTAAAIGEWEAAAGANILGNGSLTTDVLVADETTPDNVNEIYFGTIADPGVIAVTITWGYFGGSPKSRQLFEMDQVYDQADFTWNGDGNPLDMDYENIAQHEIGHGIGMGHTPTSTACQNETMYPYAANGETVKRDLGPGDIAGIDKLY